MERLNRETLARLVDETPTAEERRALAADPSARAELQALRDQTEALESLPDVLPPMGEWDALEGRLLGAGLIRAPRPQSRIGMQPAWLQIAAALVVFAGGTALGLGFSRGAPAGELSSPAQTAATFAADRRDTTVDEAAQTVRDAEERYIVALTRYRQLVAGSTTEPRFNDQASRFAALEALVAAGQAAVRAVPADPFINGILASAMAERQATLQTISASSGDWY